MPGFPDFIRTQFQALPLVPTPTAVAAGTYVVTGANTGLGYECAKHLIALDATRVILAVRSRAKGDAALANIRESTGRPKAGEVWELDLASLASVEAFATRLAKLDRLDALIENAGVGLATFSTIQGAAVDGGGLETSLAINVVATMLLAVRAVPILQTSAKRFGIVPHLVIVTSGTGLFPVLNGVLDGVEGNIFEALSREEAGMTDRYPLTKQMEIYSVRELASLLPVSKTGVVINTVNPGLCTTELSRNLNWVGRSRIALMRLLLGRTAEQGSRTLLHAAVAGEESHGKYVSDCEIKDGNIPPWMLGENGSRTQKRVWVDLVKTLEARGHKVGVPGGALAQK